MADAARLVQALLDGDREAVARMVAVPTRSGLLGAVTLCAFLGQAVHGERLPAVLSELVDLIEVPERTERPDPPG